jgi:MFS family permease
MSAQAAPTSIGLDRALPAAPSAGSATSELSLAGVIVVLVGSFLTQVDFFIVNVALPTIDKTLHASAPTLELVVAGYGIAYSVLLVVGGRLGDAFGRRRLFLAGMAAFTVTSLACGVAPNAGGLVAARVAQGLAAALMVPQVLSTIQATLDGERRAQAIGMYGAAAGLAVVVGQLFGGLLIAANIAGASWRPIFLVNVPIGLVGLVAASRLVPDTRSPNPARIDRAGTGLLGLALAALLVPLMEGRALGWPGWTWVAMAASPVLFLVFAWVEYRTEQSGRLPLLPPSILRIASMRNGLLLVLPFFTGFGGFMFVYALAMQEGVHLGAIDSGLALTPLAVAFLLVSLASPRLAARYGGRLLTVGAAVQALGLAGVALTVWAAWPGVTPLDLTPAFLLVGAGQGAVASPLFRVVLAEVPPTLAGVGSGALITTQQTALALGVATLGTLFLSLSAGSFGMRNGFLVVLGLQFVIACGVSAGSRLLGRSSR